MDNLVLEYCIGKPGEAPRMFMVSSLDQVSLNVEEGEVSFHDANFKKWPHVISKQEPWTLEASTIPLEWARMTRWMQAKSERDMHMYGGCVTPKGKVDTDLTAQTRITQFAGEAVAAKITGETTWSVDWLMADDKPVTHNADEMIALSRAVNAYIASCHSASQAVREKINAEQVGEAVMAVDVEAGYPIS